MPPKKVRTPDPDPTETTREELSEQFEAGTETPDKSGDNRPASLNGLLMTPIGAVGKNTKFSLAVQELDEMESAISELRQKGGMVKLYRRGQRESGFRWCDDMDVESFSESMIGRVWGGGDYLAQFIDSEGNKVARRSFGIDHKVKGEKDMPTTAAPDAGGLKMEDVLNLLKAEREANAPSKDNDVLKMMQISQHRSDEMMKLFLTLSMEGNKTMMSALSTMMTGRPAAEPTSKMMEAMTPLVLQMLNRQDRREENPLIKSIADLKEVKELLDDGGNEKESMFDRLLGALAPMLAQGMMQRGAGPARQPAPPPAQQLHQPTVQSEPIIINTAPASPIMSATPVDRHTSVIDRIQPFVPLLVIAASNDTDPNSYVDILLDVTSDDELRTLTGILKQPDWRTILFAKHPQTGDHSAWFEQLRTEILNATDHANQPSTDDIGPGEDTEPAGESKPDHVD